MEPSSCNAGALLCHSRACELQEPSSEPSAQGNARAQRVPNTWTPKGLRTRAREATLHACVLSPWDPQLGTSFLRNSLETATVRLLLELPRVP